MTTFNHLKFKSRCGGGVRARIFFANGYGASVVRGPGTYGEPSLYELAILVGTRDDNEYARNIHVGDEGFPDGIAGWLSEDRVTKLLKDIQALY
jgi:hypothetical protein